MSSTHSIHPIKVLVVDDNLEAVELLLRVLDHYHCRTTTAFDGEDCIPLVMKQKFDLIIIDWEMPQMGGLETLRLLEKLMSAKRLAEKLTAIPFAISSSVDELKLNLPSFTSLRYLGFISKKKSYSQMLSHFQLLIEEIQKEKKFAEYSR